MPSTQPTSLTVALESLRRPIQTFAPCHASDKRFKASMLSLTDQLEAMWSQDEDESLECDVVWATLNAFPALTMPDSNPAEPMDQATSGGHSVGLKCGITIDAETADTLSTLRRIRDILRTFRPPGFAAALCRSVLLLTYDMIRLFILIDDERSTDRCFELLDTAEALADTFAGKV